MEVSVAVLVLGLGACGGGGNSGMAPATVNGTVNGLTLTAEDAIYANEPIVGTTSTETTIAIANASMTCADGAAGKIPRNLKSVLLFLATSADGGITAITAPGTYPIGGINLASFLVFDATCQPVTASSAQATSGTVTITALSTQAISGTFDLMFGSDHLTGSFNAANCPNAGTSTANPTCI
jgi:hypothetical protein